MSRELIRVAILWQELWHEGLEEASRLFFSEKNPAGMIAVLLLSNLAKCMTKNNNTGTYNSERDFICSTVWPRTARST